MLVMKGTYRGRKMLVTVMICQREGIVMIETPVVSVRGNIIIRIVNAPENMFVTEKGKGRGIVIEKNENDMVVIIVLDTGTNLNMMRNGTEADHPEDTTNRGCLARITIAQNQGILIMGKEGGLLLNEYQIKIDFESYCKTINPLMEEEQDEEEDRKADSCQRLKTLTGEISSSTQLSYLEVERNLANVYLL